MGRIGLPRKDEVSNEGRVSVLHHCTTSKLLSSVTVNADDFHDPDNVSIPERVLNVPELPEAEVPKCEFLFNVTIIIYQ